MFSARVHYDRWRAKSLSFFELAIIELDRHLTCVGCYSIKILDPIKNAETWDICSLMVAISRGVCIS